MVKGLGVFDCYLAEHFAVEEDACHLCAVDEAAVACSAHFASGGDSGDPEAAEVALACSAIAEGEGTCAGERYFCLLFVAGFCAEVATGFSE